MTLSARLLGSAAFVLGSLLPALAQVPYSNTLSVLQLTSATTAYVANNLIATNATAASVSVPFITINNPKNGTATDRLELLSNDSTSTAWGAQTIQIDLWAGTVNASGVLVAPTFTNGDRGAFAVATGSAGHKASFTCTMGAVNGDGVYGECSLVVGTWAALVPPSGSTGFWWTAKAVTGSGVTGVSKTLTLVLESAN